MTSPRSSASCSLILALKVRRLVKREGKTQNPEAFTGSVASDAAVDAMVASSIVIGCGNT